MGRTKTLHTQSGTHEYLCTCTYDTWDAPGELCAACEMAGEDFEDDMPFDFHEWSEMHRESEETNGIAKTTEQASNG